ncbi:molybdopterin dinucleotide binding domain-containing protein [Streptomyces vietnamensis]|uniref:molybdopterin dinucleotide binding domain-containing protein n=1 Tax=Streptomyces vietnamensis TaxID=362257 RepID=UPI0034285CA7
MTRRGGNLLLDAHDRLDLHPEDAARHGLRDGTPVTVESRHGQARLVAASEGNSLPDRSSARSIFRPAASTHSPRSTPTP